MLAGAEDAEVVAALRKRAEDLGEGGTRDRTAAVDLWGTLARAVPSLSGDAGDAITAICDELAPSDGLGAVDVLSAAASELVQLPRPSAARKRTQEALAWLIEALADPDALSDGDQAHLGRELAGTLARLTQAVADTGATRKALDDIVRLLKSLPEGLRVGVLGDVISERAQTLAEAGQARRAEKARKASADAKEEKNAARRAQYREARPKQGKKPGQVRRTPATRRAHAHRTSAGLLPAGDDPPPDHARLLQEADEQLGAGNRLWSRELLEAALRCSPASSSQSSAPEDWTVGLSQALGTAGEFSAAEALAERLPCMPDRVRHLAALSLGCSLGEQGDVGGHYAREAARQMPDCADPGLANVVAQALACAGDGPAALATAMGRTAAERRQVLTAVAAGLARHCPEEAARIAEPLAEALMRRIDTGSPFRVIPELAALLLAYPDIRHPGPGLHKALRLASFRMADASQPWHAPSMAVLTLLERLDCLPEENTHVVASLTDRWQRSLQPGEVPCAEIALLFAAEGDTDALWRHVEAARTPDGRAAVLCAAAAHLAGAPIALATDSWADDRVARTCLALARTSGDGSPPAEATARRLVRRLLGTDAWARTIPLLPQLAPGALAHLKAIAGM